MFYLKPIFNTLLILFLIFTKFHINLSLLIINKHKINFIDLKEYIFIMIRNINLIYVKKLTKFCFIFEIVY